MLQYYCQHGVVSWHTLKPQKYEINPRIQSLYMLLEEQKCVVILL